MSMRGAFFFGGEQTIVWLQDSTSYAPQTMYTSFKLTKSPLLSIQDNQLPSFFYHQTYTFGNHEPLNQYTTSFS